MRRTRARLLGCMVLWMVLGYPLVPDVARAYDTMWNPNWSIDLWDSGYSDWMISPHGHEQLCGDWAAAVNYAGIPGGESMWLEPSWSRPEWTSNSQFTTVVPFQSYDDPTNPVVGKDTGSGVISNGQLKITIDASMREGRTAIGLSPASPDYTLSHWYPMLQTYTLENITNHDLTDIALFQFMHAHPNDDYGLNNFGVYDSTPYSDPDDSFQEYRYDMSFFGSLAEWQPYLDDVVGFSSTTEPDEWGLGSFPGHLGEPGIDSLHHLVEADALPDGIFLGPTEIAGVMKWNLGTLAPGQSVQFTVLFYTAHTERGVTPPTSAIPAPGAILLGTVGAGLVGWLRRRRTL